jgi:hypothetical protein
MVNLTKAQIHSAQLLFEAIDQFEILLKYYSEDKAGPAYIQCKYVNNNPEIQLDRSIMTTAIRSQLTVYYDALTAMGITYTKPEEIG